MYQLVLRFLQESYIQSMSGVKAGSCEQNPLIENFQLWVIRPSLIIVAQGPDLVVLAAIDQHYIIYYMQYMQVANYSRQ